MSITRRTFIKASASSAGGLLIGFHLPALGIDGEARKTGAEINAWLTIDPDDTITVTVAKTEMGQGVFTSLPMIVAEELEADFRRVKATFADYNRHVREGGLYGRTATRNSSSVSESRPYLQQAGAEARERLIKAAAEKWLVPVDECYADYGRVFRRRSRDSFSFGELAAAAAEVSVANVRIKTPDEFNNLGLPTQRLDVPAKVDGTAKFGIDVRLPDMVYATVVHCPVIGGRLRSMRYNAIREMPGVIRAIRMDNAVAVVAETFWQASQAAKELPVFWEIGDAEETFSNTIRDEFVSEFNRRPDVVLAEKGDITNLMDYAEKSIESDYHVPYVAHAAIEPLNCTVHVTEERVDVWCGHQDPIRLIKAVSDLTGLAPEQVYFHNQMTGGAFGRRQHTDFVEEAVLIALEIGQPVQMIWTREEEMRVGSYRPMSTVRFKAAFDHEKNLVAMTLHSVSHSVREDPDGVDPAAIEGLVDHPYTIPDYRYSHTRKTTHLTSWWWRSRGHAFNAFAIECFVDEMASQAGMDPVRYRKYLLGDQPEYINVLNKLEGISQLRTRTPPRGSALGLAIHKSFGTVVGMVADVTVLGNGTMKVNKITAVIDCGNLVNPLAAKGQIEGAIMFGLSAAVYDKLTVENGRILEDNFDTYRMATMKDVPEIDIHFELSGGDHWGGLGEPAVPVVAPAICNALYKITGRRMRSLPIADYYLRVR